MTRNDQAVPTNRFDFIIQKSMINAFNVYFFNSIQKMKTTKMMVILWLLIFITWCSSINIKDSENNDDMLETWAIMEIEEDSTEDVLEIVEDSEDLTEDIVKTTDDTLIETELNEEETALTEKIKTLIDDRKAEAEANEEDLTEEDIELMENILQAIVDGTN